MALSNAERQQRYRERLKAQANGVTPEMVHEAARVYHARYCTLNDDTAPSWEEYLQRCGSKRGRDQWAEFIPDDISPDAWDWIEDEAERALLTKVAAVAHAIRNPPKP